MDAVIAMGFEGRANTLDVAVEKIRVDDVDVYVLAPEGADTERRRGRSTTTSTAAPSSPEAATCAG